MDKEDKRKRTEGNKAVSNHQKKESWKNVNKKKEI